MVASAVVEKRTHSELRPRRTIANRVLASFAFTLVAFAITVGWSVAAQRRAAEDNFELANGYVPVALRLGQVRATQATVATLIDRIPDERNPLSTRLLLVMLTSVRHTKLVETRQAIAGGLHDFGDAGARALSSELLRELEAIGSQVAEDKEELDHLFAAIDAGSSEDINRTLVTLGAIEHDADRRIRVLADRLATAMDELNESTRARERRSIIALIALAVLTLGVGVLVSFHVRRLLEPLAKVTERARAVARGDLTAREVVATDDEIGELAVAFEKMVDAVGKAQSRAVANERFAAIGKMAAHVTHEIRNPLSSIGLNIELLEEDLESGHGEGEARALLGAVKREVERLEHLSEEYLRVARLPQPRMEADDVASTVREVVSFVEPEMSRAGCELALSIEQPLPIALYDEAQIRQALLNLLRNARESMPNGGRIDLGVASEGMSVVVRVEDRGGGIPDEIRSRVFDPFFSTKGEGTGLGLAITRQIVEAHGGTVACEGREGGGTSFRVALPIAPSRSQKPPSRPVMRAASG